MNRAAQFRRVAVVVVFASAALVGVVVAAAGIDRPTDVPTESAVRVAVPNRAVLIGDSAISALRWVPGADNAIVGFGHTLDLESCRRLFHESCRGREQRKPPTVYEAMDFHAGKYRTLIVATGYNDDSFALDEAFVAIVNKARVQRFERIIWFTLRSDVDYVSPGFIGHHRSFAEQNASLRRLVASGRYPEVVIADWGGYSADRPEWFVTEGVHYRSVGAWAASDYITRKVAFLDGRACPFATSPNEEPSDPCPDPDVTGPIADIEGLYPIGEDGVLCYEIGEERRIECRFDTHVIQLTRVLQFGDNGDDVRALQTRLTRLGFLTEYGNGNFGPATEAAVRAFQASAGIAANGIADAPTLGALGFDTGGIAP